MCSSAVQCIVEDVVNEFVAANRAEFTAYDVTIEARKRTKEEFFHGEVKNLIHRMMDKMSAKYGRRPHSLHNAWEYYLLPIPTGVVNSPVCKGNLDVVKINNLLNQAATFPLDVFKYADDNKDTATENKSRGLFAGKESDLYTDCRGRLCLRKKDTESLQWKPGDKVYVRRFPNSIQVSKNSTRCSAVFKVDKYGNVRLTQRVLNFDNKGGSGPYKYKTVSDKVVVVPSKSV